MGADEFSSAFIFFYHKLVDSMAFHWEYIKCIDTYNIPTIG